MKCIGCDGEIPWDGKGYFAYTCPCGATVFYDEHDIAPPASLIIALHERRELSHIDYYVGVSSYTSELKEKLIEELKQKGAIWSWECSQCQDRFLERQKMLIRDGLTIISSLHPDLRKRL